MRRDERGQAVTLNYTLGIAIATVLVTGVLIAGAGFVSNQQERAARTELEVIGQQVAADVEAVDRLANTTDAGDRVTVTRRLPSTVTGSSYDVELVAAADPYLELTSENPDVTVTVEFTNQTSVAESRVSGGAVRVNYTAAGDVVLEGGRSS